jgi:hypothetical protein
MIVAVDLVDVDLVGAGLAGADRADLAGADRVDLAGADRVDLAGADRVDLAGADRVDQADQAVELPPAATNPASIKEPETWHRFQNVLNTASRNAATGEARPAAE